MSQPAQPLRLAVYGHLNGDATSSSASHYLLVERMLRLGHFVDLYAIAGFVAPGELARFPNLSYYPTELPLDDAVVRTCRECLPRPLDTLTSFFLNDVRHRHYYRRLARAMRGRHQERPYDALAILDLYYNPFPPIAGLPCVIWMQGAQRAELDAIRKHKATIVQLCGRAYYWMLVAYYRYKVAVAGRYLKSDRESRIISCSTWGAESFERLGIDPRRIHVLPFILDLERFRPPASWDGRGRRVVFLHLGRVVPRKRLDLLVEAFARLRADDPDVSLLVVGRFAYAEGYRRLLLSGPAAAGIEHRPGVSRAEVPGLLRSVDALVQPSENEAFGSAVMEALGSGLPVIAGPTNGTAEYAPADFLFEEHTPESLLAAMRRCVAALRADRAAVARRARRAAETAFDVARVTDGFLDVVRGAAEPRPRTAAVGVP
jgi:glycosyltransferase involved in cell wall biosynthesis